MGHGWPLGVCEALGRGGFRHSSTSPARLHDIHLVTTSIAVIRESSFENAGHLSWVDLAVFFDVGAEILSV
jgi:hypothetical protein